MWQKQLWPDSPGCFKLTEKLASNKYPNSMKRTSRLLMLQLAALVALFSFGVRAYAEPPRDEVAHAYWLLKSADRDYAGHRAEALHAVEAVGRDLGLDLKGELPRGERQWKSDAQLREAGRLLRDARDKLEDRDRRRAADRLDHAIREIDTALNVR